jgi:hypothetical protein
MHYLIWQASHREKEEADFSLLHRRRSQVNSKFTLLQSRKFSVRWCGCGGGKRA